VKKSRRPTVKVRRGSTPRPHIAVKVRRPSGHIKSPTKAGARGPIASPGFHKKVDIGRANAAKRKFRRVDPKAGPSKRFHKKP